MSGLHWIPLVFGSPDDTFRFWLPALPLLAWQLGFDPHWLFLNSVWLDYPKTYVGTNVWVAGCFITCQCTYCWYAFWEMWIVLAATSGSGKCIQVGHWFFTMKLLVCTDWCPVSLTFVALVWALIFHTLLLDYFSASKLTHII